MRVFRSFIAATAVLVSLLAVRTGAARSSMAVWTAVDTVKVLATARAAAGGSISLAGARNEVVSFQLIVTAGATPLHAVDAAPWALTAPRRPAIAARQYQLYRETYQQISRPSDAAGKTGEWPDGLIPIGRDPIVGERRNGAPFAIPAGRSGGIWVDIAIPAHQPAGRYHGSISISARGHRPVVLAISLQVWNFGIPSQSSLTTAFGFDNWAAYQEHYGPTWETGKIVALTKRYAEAALRLRFSLYGIGVAGPDYRYDDSSHRISPLDWSAWDATEAPGFNGALDENGRRLTSSELPVPNNLSDLSHDHNAEDVAFWRAVAQHYRRRGWLSRSFLYTDDEPGSAADYRLAALHARLLHQADPQLRYLLTTAYRADMAGKVNIWVPIINELDSPGYPRPSAYYQRQAAGDQVWWYDSDSSADRGQWPDMFIDHPAMNQRVLGWMTWRYRLQGFLYYEVDYAYSLHNNPWTNVYFFGANGDGTLFYPGKPSIIGGKTDIPCPSIRAMLVRQSLQDYEYMRLLAAHGRRADADRAVRMVVRSADSFTRDPAVLERARRMMGNELSSLLGARSHGS